MPIVHLICRGRAAADFAGHPAPGLDAEGRGQAKAAPAARVRECQPAICGR